MTETRTTTPVVFVLIAVFLWSTGGLFIKSTTIDAFQVTFFRSLFAAITVLIVTRKSGLKIDLFGIFTSVIYALLLFLFVWATKKTTAANAIFLQYTAPIYILILGPFIIGEKFHLRDLITVVIVLAGMSLFFVEQLRIEDYQGNAAALLSGIFLGLYIMLLRHPKAEGFNPAIAVIYGNFLLALMNAPSGIDDVHGLVRGRIPRSFPDRDLVHSLHQGGPWRHSPARRQSNRLHRTAFESRFGVPVRRRTPLCMGGPRRGDNNHRHRGPHCPSIRPRRCAAVNASSNKERAAGNFPPPARPNV
jgi:hypothetical protein